MAQSRYKPTIEDVDSIMEQHGDTNVLGYTPKLEDIDEAMKPKTPKNIMEAIQQGSAFGRGNELLSKLPGDVIFKMMNASEKTPQALKTFGGDLASLWKGLMHSPTTIAKKYEASKEVYPEVREQMRNDPARFARNVGAGTADIGMEVANIPHGVGKIGEHYGFVNPEEVPKAKDISKPLQEFVGGEQTNADRAIRKLVGHVPDIMGGAGLARGALRAIPFTENVAKNVVKAGEKQLAKHQPMYKDIFERGNQQGYGTVNFNPQNIDIATLKGGSVPRHTEAIEEFFQNPSLENAHRAKSDVKNIIREIEEKYGSTHIPKEEHNYLQAAIKAKEELENNMFKHPTTGKVNKELKSNYENIQKSYAENVIPYNKNESINLYKNRKLTARKLLQSLKGGEFEVKKGGKHPGIKANEFLKKYGIPLSIGGLVAYPAFLGAEDILKDLLSPNSEQSPKGY